MLACRCSTRSRSVRTGAVLREGKGGGAAADDDVGNGDDEDDDEEEDDDVCCTWRPAVDATTVAAPGQGGRQRCTAGRTRGRRKGAPAGWARKASRDRAMATAARGAQLGVHTSWMMGVLPSLDVHLPRGASRDAQPRRPAGCGGGAVHALIS